VTTHSFVKDVPLNLYLTDMWRLLTMEV